MEQEGTSLMEPTGAAPLRPTDLREIGPYRLLGRLGEGGMGTVFLARAPTGRFVALKVVKAEFANQEGFAARFHAEVENARRVASFCTAQVLDNGNTGDGRPYMVTEYIAGTPLSAQITNYGALDPGPLHGVALGVAAALAAIHVAGLVHRDLKPANVILSISGPRVIDFGIARALDRETGFTMSGELLGSPGWWAPEQVRGEAVSPAADIFAWGCLVAYAGNGRHPFGRGDPITLATRVLNNPPDLGALPAPLNELVRRATSMDAALRPSAQDLLIALVGGTAPAPTTAAPVADPPTLVATEMLGEWEPPQNVVNEPDITATFTTPPPSDATGVKGGAVAPEAVTGPGSDSEAATGPGAGSEAVTGPGSGSGVATGPGVGSGAVTGPGSGSGVATGPGAGSGAGRQRGVPPAASGAGAAGPSPSAPEHDQASIEERARREEEAAKEELARWKVPGQTEPPAGAGRVLGLFSFGRRSRGAGQEDGAPSQPGADQNVGTARGGGESAPAGEPAAAGGPAQRDGAPSRSGGAASDSGPVPRGEARQGGGPLPGGESLPGAKPLPEGVLPGRRLSAETLPGTRAPLGTPVDEPDTLNGTRAPGTRWLIAAVAAVAAIVVTVAVLIATSGRNTPITANQAAPSQVAGSAKPNDVGRRFALGPNFDDPVAIVAVAPECGLKTYQDMSAAKGQLCVVRWTMINPGGERRELVQPVVTMVDDRGAEHDAAALTLPPAILPGGRLDSAFVFDMAAYRRPVTMTATMLENGQQIEVALG
ncbi:serine/threonine-protein kinase [Nonomuraea salmonea]|uniref:Serine/threonine-protein kinase n=1 Tax=Nonomuraea salmonea TaxID=46181 RepID=A0ABV5NM54_9ACTN